MDVKVSFQAHLDESEWVPKVIEDLYFKLANNEDLAVQLESSLSLAKESASKDLDKLLFDALNWPTDWLDYVKYVFRFCHWVPHQSSNPAWTDPDTDEQQEVYDHLCHFYYLIDQSTNESDDRIQNDPWFSLWLVHFVKTWGEFLNTTESFNEEVLGSFINNSPKYRVEDSMIDGRSNNPSGWLTFNQFFARELNPGLRPISSPTDNKIVVSPADCTFRAMYDIAADSTIPSIYLKRTHQYGTVQRLMDNSQYGGAFANGKMVHYFLAPYSYHRYHTPVAGLLKECRAVQGLAYLEVYIANGQFDAPDNSETGYEFSQARGVAVIDTTQSLYNNVGLVAVLPVGMCHVSSVNMTAQPGNVLEKGEEFGYFLFGGSDIIVLFQEGIDPTIYNGEQYRNYGTPIAKCA